MGIYFEKMLQILEVGVVSSNLELSTQKNEIGRLAVSERPHEENGKFLQANKGGVI